MFHCEVYFSTNMAKRMDYASYLPIRGEDSDLHMSHLAVRPAQLDLIHAPQFVDVLGELVSNLF